MLRGILGYWRPEYLKREFVKIARSNRTGLVIAVSERLNHGWSVKTVERLEDQIVWFKRVAAEAGTRGGGAARKPPPFHLTRSSA